MRGVGETTAAITVVNALPTGVGAAVGIDLAARAEVELRPAGSHGKWDLEVEPSHRTPLVIAALDLGLNRFAPGSSGTGSLRLASDIPPGQGLKSSSAVSTAVLLAVANATDAPVEPIEIARLSSAASKTAGVSATGAFDDALAGLVDDIVVTDNRKCEVLARYAAPRDLEVALVLPPSHHRPSPEWVARFTARAEEGQDAVRAALAGDWVGAMRANSELVERIVGYDYRALRERLARAGAVTAGVSGLGPAVAAVTPRDRLPSVLAAFPPTVGDRRSLRFSRSAHPARAESR